jgi:hypothetical protein
MAYSHDRVVEAISIGRSSDLQVNQITAGKRAFSVSIADVLQDRSPSSRKDLQSRLVPLLALSTSLSVDFCDHRRETMRSRTADHVSDPLGDSADLECIRAVVYGFS